MTEESGHQPICLSDYFLNADVVTLLVGSDRKPFTIHKQPLVLQSDWLVKVVASEDKRAKARRFTYQMLTSKPLRASSIEFTGRVEFEHHRTIHRQRLVSHKI